jgi:uncharacterized protein (TIGR04168 family)
MTSCASPPLNPASPTENRPLTVAVIGDVHDQWSPLDAVALHHLAVDLALFVGDFGNEVVDLVQQIADLDLPKAVILGNHDAWYTATDWGRKKCPYDRRQEDRVEQQLLALGQCHVGYGHLDLPALGLSVVGGRPFSWGGSEWKHQSFYAQRYGIHNFAESIARLHQAVDATASDQLLFIGHCGPAGLGAHPEDPCGRDWKPLGGDFGDPDLAAAIAYAKARGKTVPLVAFGHMHHSLRHRKDCHRRSTHWDDDHTFYLNAARVPRWIQTDGLTQRNFSLVTLQHRQVQAASCLWMDDQHHITHQDPLVHSPVALKFG